MSRCILKSTLLLAGALLIVSPTRGAPLRVEQVERALLSTASDHAPSIKCATELRAAALRMRSQLSERALAVLDASLAKRALDQTFLSAGGHFEIRYSIAGTDSVPVADLDGTGVPDYVEWVAEAMEQSWDQEITQLGFPAPPLGPTERYQVWMNEIPSYYGSTAQGPYPGGSVIRINQDFYAFYQRNPGLIADDPDGPVRGGIRVTAAHEFKHAIQLVQSNWSEPGGWLELDATFMEDVVFDQVNDYHNYTDDPGSPFTAPQTPLTSASYEDSTWEHFLLQRWGWPVIMSYWNRRASVLGSEAPEQTYAVAAADNGIDWALSWGEYQSWNYASGSRATAGFGFAEADSYPAPPSLVLINTQNYTSPVFSLSPLSARYHTMDNSSRVRKGVATLHFDGTPTRAWSAGLLLQGGGQTQYLPAMFDAGVGSLTTTGIGMERFDTIAVIVGNASTSGGAGSYTYSFSSTDSAIVRVEHPSFGGLKGRFQPPPQSRNSP